MNALTDLVILVPDRNVEAALDGLLATPARLGMRNLSFEIHVHVHRDPGCFLTAHEFLRPFAGRCAHALVVFDRIGCGREALQAEDLEQAVRFRLRDSGWADRAAAVAIDPELEIWVWSDSPHVASCLGWEGGIRELRSWMASEGLWIQEHPKPADPKRALERVLRQVRKPRSSAIYARLASSVGLDRCRDPSFARLRGILSGWFAPAGPQGDPAARTASPP